MRQRCTSLYYRLILAFVYAAVLLQPIWALAEPQDWPKPMMGNRVFSFLLFEQLEYRGGDGTDTLNWNAEGWIGRDYHKLWLKTEGEYELSKDSGGEVEVQLLYSRLVSPFWDFQAGVRYDQRYGEEPELSQTFLTLGVEGDAPYGIEAEPALFVSDDGDVSARFTGKYDLSLTQRLIAQTRFELNLAAQDVERFDLGAGLNDIELGVRLRFEIWREFAPYLGVSWLRKIGETAALTRRSREDVDTLAFVAGVRVWF